MNRIVASILLALYFTFSTGMVISKHFCMNEPAGVSLHATDSDKACNKCGMESKHGCCHDEVSVFKLTDSHASVAIDFDFKTIPVITLQQWLVSAIQNTVSATVNATEYIPPPLLSQSDQQALICVFRI